MKILSLVVFFCLLNGCNYFNAKKYEKDLLKADQLLEQGKYNDAFIVYKMVYDKDPKNSSAIFGCGVSSIANNNYTQGSFYFNEYIRIKPDADGFYYRGVVYDNTNRIPEALTDYSRAITLDSNNLKAYNNRGLLEIKLKEYSKAIDDFNYIIRKKPTEARYYNNLALAHDYLGNYAEAIDNYKKAIVLKPEDDETYFNTGVAYIHIKDYKNAKIALDKAIAINPSVGLYYKNLAIAYYYLKDLDNACMNFNKAFQLNDLKSKEYIDKLCEKFTHISI